MRVLVTGASGFLGSYLVEELVRQGRHEVVALVRSSSNISRLVELGVELRHGDMTDAASLMEAVQGVDAVVHLAAYYTFFGKKDMHMRVNVEGTRDLLEAMLYNRVPWIIYCSTTEVIGPTTGGAADEDAPSNPAYEYGASKVRAERLVMEYGEKGVRYTIVRPSGIYGPRNLDDVSYWFITTFARSIASRFMIGSGQKVLMFVHVKDVVQGFLLCLDKPEVAQGKVYFITDQRAYSYEELYGIMADILGKPRPRLHLPVFLAKIMVAPIQGLDALRGKRNFIWRIKTMDTFKVDRHYSINRAVKDLSYRPSYDLASGLRETIQWYKDNGYL